MQIIFRLVERNNFEYFEFHFVECENLLYQAI